MRRASAFMGAALVFVCAAAASAQDKPDLNGKWTVDAEKTAAANPGMPAGGPPGGAPGGRGGMGMGPMTLTLDAATLTRESEGRNGPMKTVFKLDGSETVVSQGMGEAKAKASWEGAKLNVVTTMETQMGAMTIKTVYEREGDWLVVTTTRPGRDGVEMTRKTYYKKS